MPEAKKEGRAMVERRGLQEVATHPSACSENGCQASHDAPSRPHPSFPRMNPPRTRQPSATR